MIAQVEVSTHCNAMCTYCPVTIYRSQWDSRFIDTTLFSKIIHEGIDIIKHIHLQGWGEPLLHPHFSHLLKEASRLYKTSFTTNATLLSRLADRIIEAGVDVMAVTFAGAKEETHDRIRVGNPLRLVTHNLKAFIERARSNKPHVVAIYMMLRDTVEELPQFVDLAAAIGVDEIRLSNLSYIPHPDLWHLKVYSPFFKPPPPHVLSIIQTAKEKAEKYGIKISHRNYTPIEHVECPESPTTTIYIDVKGNVAPCPYLSLTGAIRCFEGKCEKLPKVTYGNLYESSLKEILKSRNFKIFTDKFRKRTNELFAPPPDECTKCYRLYWI
ncbi:MAG: radical SAM protein [Pyrobaculum sp.]